MSTHEFNGIKAAHIKSLSLINGFTYKDCLLDPFIDCPPAFIAVRAGTVEAGKPELVSYIRVSSIASFDIEEQEAGKLWQQFNPLTETIATKAV